MMLGVVPSEPARPARAQPTSSGWWARPLVEPSSARTAGDEGEPGLGAPRESFLVFARRAHSFIAPQKKCSALGTSTQPPFRELVRLGTAVRKVSRGVLRRGTSLSERDASSARCPSRPAYATPSATALGSSDGLALAPVVVRWAFGARMAAVLVPGAAARRKVA
jgi:hypothetical protein